MRILFTLCILTCLGLGSLSAQVTRITDLNPGAEDANPTRFFDYQGLLLFRADNDTNGVELWISDGTPEGTRLVRDINEDPGSSAGNSNPDNFILFNNKVYFKARDANNGDELWETDGTTAGTRLVDDINPGSTGSNPFDFIELNGEIFFTARGADVSSELYRYDAMGDSAALVLDIRPGNSPSVPNFKTLFDGRMFFTANDGVTGTELWVSDGFDTGTFRLSDIRQDGNGNAAPSQYFVYNNELYFRADNDTLGQELYKTDGTFAPPTLVKDLVTGAGDGRPGDFFAFGGMLFFSAETDSLGRELWMTDGTEEGTVLFADLNPGPGDSDPEGFIQLIQDDVFPAGVFIADGGEGPELHQLSLFFGQIFFDAINVAPTEEELLAPEDLVWTNSTLYFSAETPTDGRELYKLGILDEFATKITDIGPGAEDGGIDEIFLIGDRLYFEADDSLGRELWTTVADRAGFQFSTADQGVVNSGDTIDLGEVLLGADIVTTNLTLTSTGTGPTVGNWLNEGAVMDPFAVLLIGNIDSIPSDSTVDFQIGFLSGEAGTFVDSLEILVLGPDGPETSFFYLKGTSVAPVGALAVSLDGTVLGEEVTEIDFGAVPSRTDSTLALVLENVGTGPLQLTPSLATGMEYTADDLSAVEIAPGATDTINLTFAPQTEGEYTDTLTLMASLDAMTDVTVTYVLRGNAIVNSVNEFGIRAQRAYPNPTVDGIMVELGEALTNGTISVFDQQGRRVREAVWPAGAQQHRVLLSGLPSGLYQVEVKSPAGRLLLEVVKR
ncbi:ELWxxDGT repeat protein [Lewinella sp. W8]|uniref:ELWxxDGT repeat protein n=1 Tax=Lewinella sp. W8 TaxID=2528208 RepID=UPI001068C9CB|nr:ELWxxDGT repeat protein [Lewinella sp. W8]MTB51071.1 choice-of-anchor D domain-containing protein [Lewinella sp. W8]